MEAMFIPRRLLILIAFPLIAACQLGGPPPATAPPPAPTVVRRTPTETPSATSTATPSEPPREPADLIFHNGAILTMAEASPRAQALAVREGVIVAVGSESEVLALQGPDTEIIDLEGRALMPGFVDPHTHILTDMGSLEAGQALALANGFTSVADASIEPGVPEGFIEAARSDVLRIRTTLYLDRTDSCGADLGTWYEDYPPDMAVSDRLRIGGVKIFADGGVCGAIAASETFLEGYENGQPFQDLETLTEMIRTADQAGYQVIIHAQGDLAIAEVQDAYAAVLGGEGNALHHRIDHNVFHTPAVLGRYTDLDLVALLFGTSEACEAELPWTDFYKQYGERPGDFLAANPDLVVAWHGDDPWMTPVSPIYELYSLVTRAAVTDDGEICQPPDWMADGGVSVDQALAMMTINAAYAIRQEAQVGSLAPGKYADLVVLSDDLLTISTDSIPDVRVLATIIGGATEYCAPEAEALCPGYEPPEGPRGTASASRSGHGPQLAFDGLATGESFWSSGADAPQWIRVDFAEPVRLNEIRFVVYQNPPSDTVHALELLVDGEWRQVETFRGFTATGDVLTWRPRSPLEHVEAFRMTTLESLSWPEWYEIEVDTGGG